MTPRRIRRTLRRAEKLFGLPRGLLYKIAKIESNLNPDAVNPKTKAAGIFQFLELTAREENIRPHDVAESAAATAKRIARLLKRIEGLYLPIPVPTFLYLAHQQGERGISEICACANGAMPVLPASRIVSMSANLYGESARAFADAKDHPAKVKVFLDFWKARIA